MYVCVCGGGGLLFGFWGFVFSSWVFGCCFFLLFFFGGGGLVCRSLCPRKKGLCQMKGGWSFLLIHLSVVCQQRYG